MRLLILFTVAAGAALAADPNPDAEAAAKRAVVPAGLSVSLWAAEPLLANPVAITFDEKGRCYVAETTRFEKGVPDTRSHMYWLDDDLACRSVEDRLKMYEKHKFGDFEKYDDQIRRVWDESGKGVADRSTIFAKGFNKPKDGLAAGVLARKGDIFFTCIPSLYKFRNTDGVGEKKEILSTGYGIHVQFLGHDLHGLRFGPDGQLYFSIGDRGFNVVNKEGKRISNPDSGAVLRCEPDGSNLEIIHIGLRNPQKLAFDDHGNLFTYDNNCDSGDKARWVQIVPGGDSGWRCGYQYGTYYHSPAVKEGNRGPWNAEKLWHTQHEGQPAYILPPLIHFGNGPSGITHYPGVGLPDKYKNHFFACDFTASPGGSIIWSLECKPKGASFEVADLHPFVKQMVPTDCEFGPDCNFYWSDWTGGWNPPMKGRIFKVTDPEAQKNPAVKEAKELLAAGMEKKSIDELLVLLEHAHQGVRQEAQYELAVRKSVEPIAQYLSQCKSQFAKLHCIWALGQIHRREKREPVELLALLKDEDMEARAQAATMLADALTVSERTSAALLPLLKDAEPRVQFLAALALARLGKRVVPSSESFAEVFDFARRAGSDPYRRHAAVHALANYFREKDDLAARAADNSLTTPERRMCLVLAYRAAGKPLRLVKHLMEENNPIAIEAARAIYDERMMLVMSTLAGQWERPRLPEPLAVRVLAANYLLGAPENAHALGEVLARPGESEAIRMLALKLLADWPKPPRRDPITGLTIDLKPRDPAPAREAIRPHLEAIFTGGGDAMRKEAVRCVRKLDMPEAGLLLANFIAISRVGGMARADALFALQELNAKELKDALAHAEQSGEPTLRGAARVVRLRGDAKLAAEFGPILDDEKTSSIEKQMMLAALGPLPESKAADEILAAWLDRMIAGTAPPEMKLEVVEGVTARTKKEKLKLHTDLKKKLAEYDAAVKKAAGDKLEKRYPEALSGGDAERGRSLFLNNAAVSCQKCHKLDNEGGEVGPPLNGIGMAKSREYLLEALLVPNAQIAEGYKTVILELGSGKKVSGVLKEKTKEKYVLMTAEGKRLEIAADDVEKEKPDKSAMPDDVAKLLTRREIRDLVEFLAGLKE